VSSRQGAHVVHSVRALAVAALIGLLGASALAAADGGPRQYEVAAAQWPTDEPVRKGMVAIRDLVRTNHSLITHRRMPPDHAVRFAAQVKIEADRILATSHIPSEARDHLHLLLAEIVTGIGAVATPEGGVNPLDGLVRADEALARYPKEFDHPGWAPVQSLD
jgi:hypothetical protein